jgi:hypothetical protein
VNHYFVTEYAGYIEVAPGLFRVIHSTVDEPDFYLVSISNAAAEELAGATDTLRYLPNGKPAVIVEMSSS